ncbi:MAG: hypothetical protein Alpg2KO_18000 [Alphaproteobacteria bacterium]
MKILSLALAAAMMVPGIASASDPLLAPYEYAVDPTNFSRARLVHGDVSLNEIAGVDSRLEAIAGDDGRLNTEGEKLAALVWAFNHKYESCDVMVGGQAMPVCTADGAQALYDNHPRHARGLISLIDKANGGDQAVVSILNRMLIRDRNID